MQQLVGILQSSALPRKSDILFFDKFAVLRNHILLGPNDPNDASREADFDYLKKIGFINKIDTDVDALTNEAGKAGFEVDDITKTVKKLRDYPLQEPHWTGGRPPPMGSSLPEHHRKHASHTSKVWISEIESRLCSILHSSNSKTYAPILRTDEFQFPANIKADAIRVIVNNFPHPGDNVPYDELLDFKNDTEIKQDLEAFRRWLRVKLRSEDLNFFELQEELADTLSDYKNHMSLAKMRYKTRSIYILLSFPLATIEKIAKFEFSKLIDPLYEFRMCKLDLMEAEANAPGRELAYISKAGDIF